MITAAKEMTKVTGVKVGGWSRQWVVKRGSFQERGSRQRPECQGICSPGRGNRGVANVLGELDLPETPMLDGGVGGEDGRWHQMMRRGGPDLEPE